VQVVIKALINLIYKGYIYYKASKVLILSQLKTKKQTSYNLYIKLDLDKELFKDRANSIKEALTELRYKWRIRYTYNINILSSKNLYSLNIVLFLFFFNSLLFLVVFLPKLIGNGKFTSIFILKLSPQNLKNPIALGKIPYYPS